MTKVEIHEGFIVGEHNGRGFRFELPGADPAESVPVGGRFVGETEDYRQCLILLNRGDIRPDRDYPAVARLLSRPGDPKHQIQMTIEY